MSTPIQLWPPPNDDGSQDSTRDLPVGDHVFHFDVGRFSRGSICYSLTSAPVAPVAAIVIMYQVIVHKDVGDNDRFELPSTGQFVLPPGSASLQGLVVYEGRTLSQIRVEMTAAELLPGFRLYGRFSTSGGDLR